MSVKTSTTITGTYLKTGTLNVRGIVDDQKKTALANDLHRNNIQICAVQETHLTEIGVLEIQTSDKGKTYDLYYTGPTNHSNHGIGIVCVKGLQRDYTQNFRESVTDYAKQSST